MNQVRTVLAVFTAALALAACEGTGSITDPGFRNSKAAPTAQAGSGFHRDNGGWVGSGYDAATCDNTGTLGSGYDASTACYAADNGGTFGSGYIVTPDRSHAMPGIRPTPVHGKQSIGDKGTAPGRPTLDCVRDNGGTYGSGYNVCP
jgi:hypothetical protein